MHTALARAREWLCSDRNIRCTYKYIISVLIYDLIDMSKTQFYPSRVVAELARIGDGIRVARLRRRMTQAELAAHVGITNQTIIKMEKGAPGTSLGNYLKALWVLGVLDSVEAVADPARDQEGLILEAASASKRARAPRLTNDF